MKTLKEAYAGYFKIGAAVSRRMIKTHEELITTHFNSITCGNEMKPASLYNQDKEPDFTGADEVHAFAVKNNIEMRGHTLIWHNQTPEWIMSAENIEAHMKLVSEKYDKNLYAWDVVNEAIDDKHDLFLRQTKWLENLGENYLTDVFKMAGKYFSGKDLYYNDYNDATPNKREKMIKLIKQLKENGAPVNGLGLQAHYNIYTPTIDEIKASIELYAGLGVKLSVTEMDVSVFRFEDHSSLPAPTAELIEKQAEYYRQCFKIYREYKDHIDSVTLWGVADDATWLDHFPARGRKNWPLLFDAEHKPKEAFWRVIDF